MPENLLKKNQKQSK